MTKMLQVVTQHHTMIQGLLINDIPLHQLGRVEEEWQEVIGAPDLFGKPFHVPLRPGAVAVPQVVGPREFGVGVAVYSQTKDQAGHNQQWRDLARLLWSPRKTLNIKRTLRFPGGDETHECAAKYVSGLDPNLLAGGHVGRMALRFTNLDGYWYDISNSTFTIPNLVTTAVDMPGDASTRRMTLTFSGGSGLQTLVNNTTGAAISLSKDTSSTPITLDVLAFTTDMTPAADGGDPGVRSVNHAGDVFWMVMDPGENEFDLTGGGSVEINARAAYL